MIRADLADIDSQKNSKTDRDSENRQNRTDSLEKVEEIRWVTATTKPGVEIKVKMKPVILTNLEPCLLENLAMAEAGDKLEGAGNDKQEEEVVVVVVEEEEEEETFGDLAAAGAQEKVLLNEVDHVGKTGGVGK